MITNYYRMLIKDYRKGHGITQEKLAELLGYDPTYISHIETGRREPNIDFLIKFSNLSGISIDYMLCCETQIGTQIKMDENRRRIIKLPPKDRELVFKLEDVLLERLEQDSQNYTD